MVVRLVDLASCWFPAMGTNVHVLVLDGSDSHLHWARAEVARSEDRWSRFCPNSDVSRLTLHAGTWVPVAVETVELLHEAVRVQASTSGAFDPLLGTHLAALGYDRTFSDVERDSAGVANVSPSVRPAEGIEIQDGECLARIPAGTALDLGGIAKGWTADQIASALVAKGARGACVNLGGDLAVAGEAPDPAGWVVEVERTNASAPPGLLALRSGGLATSTTQRRSWFGPQGDRRHHLLDPSTGTPCVGSLVDITVVASSAAAAEVLTKVAFVTPERLEVALCAVGAAALLTLSDGTVIESGERACLRGLGVSRTDAG